MDETDSGDDLRGVPSVGPDAGLGPDAADDMPEPSDDVDHSGGTDTPDCGLGFDVDGDHCVLNPDSRWDLEIVDGSFTPLKPSGSNWDISGGLPDGYVWIEFGPDDDETETDPVQDNLEPSWGTHVLWSVSAAELRAHFDFGLWDDDPWDITGDDEMARCSPILPETVFTGDVIDMSTVDPSCPQVRVVFTAAP